MSRDPRFDPRTGAFNDNLFKKSFSFLDDIKQRERKVKFKVLHCILVNLLLLGHSGGY